MHTNRSEQKSPTNSQKRPTYLQKRLTNLQKNTTYLRQSPVDPYRSVVPMCTGSIYNRCTPTDVHTKRCEQKRPTYLQKRPTNLQKNTTNLQKSPIDPYRYVVPMCNGSIHNRCTTTDANKRAQHIRKRAPHFHVCPWQCSTHPLPPHKYDTFSTDERVVSDLFFSQKDRRFISDVSFARKNESRPTYDRVMCDTRTRI